MDYTLCHFRGKQSQYTLFIIIHFNKEVESCNCLFAPSFMRLNSKKFTLYLFVRFQKRNKWKSKIVIDSDTNQCLISLPNIMYSLPVCCPVHPRVPPWMHALWRHVPPSASHTADDLHLRPDAFPGAHLYDVISIACCHGDDDAGAGRYSARLQAQVSIPDVCLRLPGNRQIKGNR